MLRVGIKTTKLIAAKGKEEFITEKIQLNIHEKQPQLGIAWFSLLPTLLIIFFVEVRFESRFIKNSKPILDSDFQLIGAYHKWEVLMAEGGGFVWIGTHERRERRGRKVCRKVTMGAKWHELYVECVERRRERVRKRFGGSIYYVVFFDPPPPSPPSI